MAIKHRITLLLLLATAVLNAQNPFWENYVSSYGIRNLAFSSTHAWGLSGSLLKMDLATHQITQFTPANNGFPLHDFRDLDVDPAGNAWLILQSPNSNALYRFDGSTLSSWHAEAGVRGFTSMAVAGINNIWLTYSYGLVHFNGQSFDNVLCDYPYDFFECRDLQVDRLGRIWFLAEYYVEPFMYYGLFRWDGSNLEEFDTEPYYIDRPIIYAFDNQNNLWLAHLTQGLLSYVNGVWTHYTAANSGLLSNYIRSMVFDSGGTLWLISDLGINSFDGTQWQSFTEQNSAWDGRYLRGAFRGPGQSVWLVSNHNILVAEGNTLSEIDCGGAGFPNQYSRAQARDQDGLWWFVLFNDLASFDGNTWQIYPLPIPYMYPKNICIDSAGKLWLAGNKGLLLRVGDRWTHFDSSNSPLPDDICHSVAEDTQGRIWVANEQGLACYDGQNWQIYNSSNAPFPENYIDLVRVDPQGRVWVSGFRGLACLEGQTWTFYATPNMENAYGFILDIDFWQGTVWLSMCGGLAKQENGGWTLYTSSNSGLPNDHIYSADTDRHGMLWLVTNNGLSRFDGQQWLNFNTGNSALAWDTCHYVIADDEDRIWTGHHLRPALSVFDYGTWLPADDPAQSPPLERLSLNCHPNPFSQELQIAVELKDAARAEISIYNLRGQKLRTLPVSSLGQGTRNVVWDGRDERGLPCASGVYLLRCTDGKSSATRKVLLMR